MARTLRVTVGYLPQPFATPSDLAVGADAAPWQADRSRVLTDVGSMLDQADAVLSTSTAATFGGTFGGTF